MSRANSGSSTYTQVQKTKETQTQTKAPGNFGIKKSITDHSLSFPANKQWRLEQCQNKIQKAQTDMHKIFLPEITY